MMVRSRISERPLDARQRPDLELADEGGLPLPEHARAEGGFGVGAAIDQRAGAVEHVEMALRRAGDGEARRCPPR